MAGTDQRLLDAETHFAFGENWASYANTIDGARIAVAEAALARLAGPGGLEGRRFLDIGCGSGLHALAALRLGAASVLGIDIDRNSVTTARRVLETHRPGANWDIREVSIFDFSPPETFEVVYSWGVLHHTGAMWPAVAKAAALVAPGGLFIVALYGKTPLCGLWTAEKRLYAHAPRWLQACIRGPYKAAFLLVKALRGENPVAYVRDYAANRGMNWHHDVHDWLGGYPYESASPGDVACRLAELGFALERRFGTIARFGLFGTGCVEYVFRRSGS